MRSITLTPIALFLALAACGGTSSATASTDPATTGSETERAPRFAQISVDEVAAAIEARDGRFMVFDANSRETYERHHVPGATWIDYDALSQEQLPADRSIQLVFYCANEHCSASHTAAESAIDLGYTNVAVMGAGIQGWIAAGQPVEGTASQGH